MKDVIKIIEYLIDILGGLSLILSNIVGIGTVVYSWGAKGLLLSTSLWIGFKVWILMIVGGLILLAFGVFLNSFSKGY